MAIRNVLHVSHLDAFKEWLTRDGWELLPTSNNIYEVLRAKKESKKHPLIIYYKGKAREHLSYADRDSAVVNAFLRDLKKKNSNLIPFTADVQSDDEMKETIYVDDILLFCRNAADTAKLCAEKAIENIGHGESQTTAYGAYAFFHQKEEMYRFFIPEIVQLLAQTKQPDECLFGYGPCYYPISDCRNCPNRKAEET